MNKLIKILSLLIITAVFYNFIVNDFVIIQQVKLDGNNINAWFYNTGIFDQDKRTTNTPGFEWPKGSGKFAIFTAGLSCGAFIQNELREFMCSYAGELAPGYIIDSVGLPKAKTDFRFRIWKVSRTDNHINNPDWLNWGIMVTYGAPFNDVNNNGIFEPLVDSPGVKGASQTLFACLTDGFPEEHKLGEGFGGGTAPMFAEVRVTAWAYNINGLKDIQFMKWMVINKNKYSWDSTFFGIVCDPDLGNADDDYIGCDTIRRLGFGYNGDNDDEQSSNTFNYGLNPPAAGILYIKTPKYNSSILGMTSFISWHTHAAGCEYDPNGPLGAYNYLKGLKTDRTPWVIPPGCNPSLITKYVYSGDPESGMGWNEGVPGNPSGSVLNCGGPDSLCGYVVPFNYPSEKKFSMNSGSKYLKVNPGDTQIIVAAQLIARGNSNLNSVTKLKQLSDVAQRFYDSGYVIGVNNVSTEIPIQFKLYQNYPNPFNPVTKIRFSIPPYQGGQGDGLTKLVIYDILGKEITTLINEQLSPDTYEIEWNGSAYPSGVYFYRLQINNYLTTKRMVLLK